MKWFKCFIAGVNFPGELIREIGLVGFYTTRFVKADTLDEVEAIALSDLKKEKSLKLPKGVFPSKSARVYFEEIEEVDSSEVPEIEVGFTFYIMETK